MIMVMFKMRSQRNNFMCFSPPVMLATMIFEFGAAIYILLFRKLDITNRLIVLLLIALGIFQAAEFGVCEQIGPLSAETMSKVGYIAIASLPPMGIHLLHIYNTSHKRTLVRGCYTVLAAFVTYFLLVPSTFKDYECTGNYVIFHLEQIPIGLFIVYYFTLLIVAVLLAGVWIYRLKNTTKPSEVSKRTSLAILLFGYLSFMVPTSVVYVIDPYYFEGVPSIMCGFAVVLAGCLVYNSLKFGKNRSRFDKTLKINK
jgi:hypothetical protein